MIKQQLSQSLLQKLSPQQIQLMKLLQIPTAVLDQRIQEELESNPALEEGPDGDEIPQDTGEDDDYEGDEKDQDNDEFTLDDYIDTLNSIILGCGLSFELPILAVVLARIGIINANFLCNNQCIQYRTASVRNLHQGLP